MSPPRRPMPPQPKWTPTCVACGSLLAFDQRYCLECGRRHGPLPAYAERLLAAVREPGALAAASAAAAAEEQRRPVFELPSMSMPSPRAAASAVLGTLAFGVVAGSGASSLAGSPAYVAFSQPAPVASAAPRPPAAAAVSPAGVDAGSSASSPGGVVVVTVQQPTPAPASSSSSTGSTGVANGVLPALPPVKHLFVIMLSDQGYNAAFGPGSKSKYLADTLRKQGELVPSYYAVAQGQLANGVAILSGQGPTPQTTTNCPAYAAIKPAKKGHLGQVLGVGCVYPKQTQTVADQLTAKKDTWKAYVEGLGKKSKDQAASCAHPALNAADSAQTARNGDAYVTWRNPFVYFGSLTSAKKDGCKQNDVGLPQLTKDLKQEASTPSLAWIVPSPCDDGSDQPCLPQAKAGLAESDKFLKSVVPEIEKSPAYKNGGLIAITFDQAPQTGPGADQSSCCNNPTYPNLPPTPVATTPATTTTTPASPPPYAIMPTTTTTTPTTPTPTTTATTPTTTTPSSAFTGGLTSPTGGGGQVGLLVISSYVKPNTTDVIDYFNHYSLLKSIESLFSLKPLGYARDPSLTGFGHALFNAYTAG